MLQETLIALFVISITVANIGSAGSVLKAGRIVFKPRRERIQSRTYDIKTRTGNLENPLKINELRLIAEV